MKTSQGNDMTDHIGLVYTENDIKLSGPIQTSAVYEESKKGNVLTDCACIVCTKNETTMLWPIGSSVVYHENQTRQQHDQLYR